MNHTDSHLVQQIHGTLTHDTRVNLNESALSIIEDNGIVTLSGTVPSVAAKRLAVRLTETVPGAKVGP